MRRRSKSWGASWPKTSAIIHTLAVYNETTKEYTSNPHTRYVTDERYTPSFGRVNMHHEIDAFPDHSFKGAWSCAAFLTHTPHEWVEPTLAQIARILAPGGIFAVSYAQRQPGQGYDYLKLSSTGRIKYFSHPKTAEIVELARRHGLALERETVNDYVEASGTVVKDLFVSQFFRKEA